MKPIDILPLITVRLQVRVRTSHLRYQQLITFTVVRGFAPGLQKFVAAIALSRGEEIGKREPLLSFALVSNFTTHL
jgi:hypothetical protein